MEHPVDARINLKKYLERDQNLQLPYEVLWYDVTT